MSGDLPTHITAEAAYTSVCQSPKVWWSSAGSRWRTLVCFHSFPQVLQYTVVEVTPITVVFTQSARHAVSSQPVPSVPHSSLYEPIDFAAADLLFEPCASSRRGRCVSTCDIDRPTQFTPESGIFVGAVVSQASPVAPDAPRASQ